MPVRRIVRTLFVAALVALVAACSTEPGSSGTGGNDALVDASSGNDAAADTGTGGQDTVATDTSAADGTVADGATDDGAIADTTDPQDTGPTGPTFGEVFTQVIVAEGCNGQYCHGGIWPDEAKAYKHLTTATVKLPACKSAAYVTPGDASKSLFWLKIDSTAVHGCGNKMPVGKKGVTAAQSKLVKDWIEAGAKP